MQYITSHWSRYVLENLLRTPLRTRGCQAGVGLYWLCVLILIFPSHLLKNAGNQRLQVLDQIEKVRGPAVPCRERRRSRKQLCRALPSLPFGKVKSSITGTGDVQGPSRVVGDSYGMLFISSLNWVY